LRAAFSGLFRTLPGSFRQQTGNSIRVTLPMMTEWPTTLDQPIPFNLISKIVKFRVKKNLERAKVKPRKK